MKRLLLILAGLLLLAFLTILCFENKVNDIKAAILNSVKTNLKDAQLDFAKPTLVGEGYKSTEIVALSGVAPSLEAKQRALQIAKDSYGVWDVKDFMSVKKVQKPKVKKVVKPKIDSMIEEKRKKEQKAKECQTKLHNLLLNSKIHFESAKAVIKEDSFELLSNIADVIKKCPGFKIEIAGYTDSDGSEDYNLLLSAKRADAIKNYLVTKEGIDPNILESRGYGEANPIADNSSDEGKSKNRRIEFNILGDE